MIRYLSTLGFRFASGTYYFTIIDSLDAEYNKPKYIEMHNAEYVYIYLDKIIKGAKHQIAILNGCGNNIKEFSTIIHMLDDLDITPFGLSEVISEYPLNSYQLAFKDLRDRGLIPFEPKVCDDPNINQRELDNYLRTSKILKYNSYLDGNHN